MYVTPIFSKQMTMLEDRISRVQFAINNNSGFYNDLMGECELIIESASRILAVVKHNAEWQKVISGIQLRAKDCIKELEKRKKNLLHVSLYWDSELIGSYEAEYLDKPNIYRICISGSDVFFSGQDLRPINPKSDTKDYSISRQYHDWFPEFPW